MKEKYIRDNYFLINKGVILALASTIFVVGICMMFFLIGYSAGKTEGYEIGFNNATIQMNIFNCINNCQHDINGSIGNPINITKNGRTYWIFSLSNPELDKCVNNCRGDKT